MPAQDPKSKPIRLFVTGIGTDVGKTVASAILVEALQADYWKPIQAGDLSHSDTHKVRARVSNAQSVFHPNAFALHTPASPHWAADIDGVQLTAADIHEPLTDNALVIEGAGGVLVPINDTETILDLIQPHYQVVVVSRHYLGSINHTLLTVQALQQAGKNILGLIFSGAEHPSTERIILSKTQLPMLGRIDEEPYFDQNVVRAYAESFQHLTELCR